MRGFEGVKLICLSQNHILFLNKRAQAVLNLFESHLRSTARWFQWSSRSEQQSVQRKWTTIHAAEVNNNPCSRSEQQSMQQKWTTIHAAESEQQSLQQKWTTIHAAEVNNNPCSGKWTTIHAAKVNNNPCNGEWTTIHAAESEQQSMQRKVKRLWSHELAISWEY